MSRRSSTNRSSIGRSTRSGLAATVVALLAPAAYDWKAMAALPTGITWIGTSPKGANPVTQSGDVTYGGRKFSAAASGTPTQVNNIALEELGLHPRGEHMLGVVYEKGIAVKLVRCGPVYTESTNNWYSLTSAKTRPAMIRQSIRYDGNREPGRKRLLSGHRTEPSLAERSPQCYVRACALSSRPGS